MMHQLSVWAMDLLVDLKINGEGNLPKKGPLLVVGNHFTFLDPVAFVRLSPWPLEFLGAAQPPFAPGWSKIITGMWGFYPLYRGTGSHNALRAAEKILSQGGVLGIFPEGGSWARVLRPARPGTAYLAASTGARLLPVGLFGFNDVFPLRFKRQAKATINIGEPFGPFEVTGRGRERRQQLDAIGRVIMKKIAALLPDELRGPYSSSPEVRAAAKKVESYPWADAVEGEVDGNDEW
jgi:1-acyl-sn-glycerol-3-phosphate acyltransferase